MMGLTDVFVKVTIFNTAIQRHVSLCKIVRDTY